MQGSTLECTSKQKIVLRADSSIEIGFGHIFRMMSVAETLGQQYEFLLVTQILPDFVREEVERIGLPYRIIKGISRSLNDRKFGDEIPFDMNGILNGNEIVVTDGYWFGTNYQLEIKRLGCKLVCIDDLAEFFFVADYVINHAPGIDKDVYRISENTKLCLGINYLIIKNIFLCQPVPKYGVSGCRVAISMGGTDIYGITEKILHEVLAIDSKFVLEVIYTHSFSEKSVSNLLAIQRQYPERVFLKFNLSSKQVAELFDSCSHAILSSSTIALECITRKVRPLIGCYTDNQKFLYSGLIKESLSIGLGNLIYDVIDKDIISNYLKNNQYSILEFQPKLACVFNELTNKAS
jgi:spore coat polysaccharide biosynthesis predicted glycosyltransferase SpsG